MEIPASDVTALTRYADVELPRMPMLVPWVEPVELSTGLLQLRSAESIYNLRHPILASAFVEVRPMLNGRYTVADIAQRPSVGILPTTVIFLLKTLHALGLLVDASQIREDAPGGPDQTLFLSQFVPDPERVAVSIATARVVVPARGPSRATSAPLSREPGPR